MIFEYQMTRLGANFKSMPMFTSSIFDLNHNKRMNEGDGEIFVKQKDNNSNNNNVTLFRFCTSEMNQIKTIQKSFFEINLNPYNDKENEAK